MRRVLVVDDSRVMRQLLKNAICSGSSEEIVFVDASDGAEALEQLESLEYAVDVVFCDLCMPKLDGIQMLDELERRGVLGTVPVIVLSGDLREGRAREVTLHGARRVLGKPFGNDEVREALESVLQEETGEHAAGDV